MATAIPLEFDLHGTHEDRLRALGVPVATTEDVRAAQATWPQGEPDQTVWRALSCAHAGGDELSDEQLHAVLRSFSLEDIAAARNRVAPLVAPVSKIGPATTLGDLLAEPTITMDEAVALGLM
jgi:hypothetical protein